MTEPDTEPDTIQVNLGPHDVVRCEQCGTLERSLLIWNEPIIADGDLKITSVIAFARCRHPVPRAWADPEKVAWVLEQPGDSYSI